MKPRSQQQPLTDVLFVLILFLLFTSFALTVVLLGAKVYESTAARMEDNYTVRTSLAYVSEKIRHFDEADAISVIEIDGTSAPASSGTADSVTALVLSEEVDGIPYRTYLYFYEGWLYELFIKADASFSLSLGNPILKLESFSIAEIESGFYEFTAASASGEQLRLLIQPKAQ